MYRSQYLYPASQFRCLTAITYSVVAFAAADEDTIGLGCQAIQGNKGWDIGRFNET